MTATDTNSVAEFDLDYLDISKATAIFEMPWLRGGPSLIVKTAMAENEKYSSASLRMSGNRIAFQNKVASGGAVTTDDADVDGKEDRTLYPKYVIVGWAGIVDKAGEPVKFNHENCKAFVKLLPRWIFDRLRIFCMRPERFLAAEDVGEQAEPNPVAVAGN